MDPRPMTRRRHTVAGLLAVVALTLASCGDSDDEPMTADMTDEAPAPSEPAETPAAAETPDDEMTTDAEEPQQEAELAPGVYRAYSADAVADPGFDTTIIFFHASWCPECRAFEQAIESSDIPDGVQILKADYDTESDLKRRYDVTIQTTFVRVDEDGDELASWVGYQKDRSVETILSELG